MPTKVTRSAFVTPTSGRQDLHPSLYETFRKQTLRRKRLYVLDESPQPSPFFGRLHDPEVVYVHRQATPRIDGVTRIGEARNFVNAMVEEPTILHADDDDWLDATYGEELVDRLGDADLAKLDTFRILHEKTGDLYEWNTRMFGGEHYAMQGDSVEKVNVSPSDLPPEIVESFFLGYGFSMAYPTETWRRHPFPVEGTEDIAFARAVKNAGGRIVFIGDCSHLVLHLVSARSVSGVYPQRHLGKMRPMFSAQPNTLREWQRRRMIGSAMNELPSGQAIQIVPGVTYRILAKVKRNHSIRDLTVRASGYGITITSARDEVPANEFGVEKPPDGYRLVLVEGTSTKAGELPWAPPKLIFFDRTSVVRAWTSAPAPMVGTLRSMP